jgi:hypothetical protein
VHENIREMTDADALSSLHDGLMFFLVLIVVFVVAAVAAHLVARPGDSPLRRAGVALTVVGAFTSALMWWLRVPFLILAIGVALLIVEGRRGRGVEGVAI